MTDILTPLLEPLKNAPFALAMTFNPQKGSGWTESILAILIVAFFLISVCFLQRELPSYAIALVSMIVGFYFGGQNTKYKKK